MTTQNRRLYLLSMASLAVLSLSACQTTTAQNQRMSKIDTALEQAAGDAMAQGKTEESLGMLEQLYKRNSSDEITATKYAAALRHAGYYKRASLVLTPFATAQGQDNVTVLNEYAAIQSAMGNYIAAETAAKQAVLADPTSGQAYHVLGVALDAQGHHEQAKVAFEKGLDNWQGDPSPILNNMGLNLAALGFIDEAMEVLRRAMATAPNRTEIERNLRIVSALQYQPPATEDDRLPPVPGSKPHNS